MREDTENHFKKMNRKRTKFSEWISE